MSGTVFLADRLRAAATSAWWLPGAGLLLGAGLLVSLSYRWASNRIIVDLQTEAVAIQVPRDVTIEPLSPRGGLRGEVTIQYAARIADLLPDAEGALASSSALALSGTAKLTELRLPQGSLLELRLQPEGGLRLLLRGGAAVIRNDGLLRDLALPDLDAAGSGMASGPVTITVAAGVGAVPLDIGLPSPSEASPLLIRETFPADRLRFAAERGAETGPPFRSAILAGTLRLRDIGREVELRANEPLRLEGLEGHVTQIAVRPDRIRLEFAGRARSVLVGPPGFEEDLSPTLLAYLHGNERLTLLWSLLAGGVAVLWGVRTWAREHQGLG